MPGPSSSSFDEDIVERRVTEPVCAALLVVSALCFAGAMALQIYEIFQYRVPGEDTVLAVAGPFHARLRRQMGRTLNEFESIRIKAEALEPSKAQGEPDFLSKEARDMARELLERYGYGPEALHPPLKEAELAPEGAPTPTPKGAKAGGTAPTGELKAEDLQSLLGTEEETSSGGAKEAEKKAPAKTEEKKTGESGDLDLDLDLDDRT